MDIKKVNKSLIYIVSFLLVLDIMNSYYGLVITLQNVAPFYSIWFQILIIDLLVMIFLHIDRLSFIGYLYLIFSITDGFIEGGYNPLYWLQRNDIQAFLGLNIWMLELIFSSLGLIAWLWLHFHHHKLRPKY